MLFVWLIISLLAIKIWSHLTLGKCVSTKRLDGKVILVTGACRGIGYQAALNFAKRGAKVIITSENENNVKQAQKKMIEESGNKNIVAKHLDLLSLSGVRAFAKDILDTESRLDVLVNNAGSFSQGRKCTEDGLPPVMQINYFGAFLLTILLLGLMKKSTHSRVVNLASVMANLGFCFDPNDIRRIKYFKDSDWRDIFEYCNSKICMVSSTIEMGNRLKGTGVTVNCLHPGLVDTGIYQHKSWVGILQGIIKRFGFKNPEEGAQTTIHLAACEKIESLTGKYFSDCDVSWVMTNLNATVRNKVWEQSIKLTGLQPEEICI